MTAFEKKENSGSHNSGNSSSSGIKTEPGIDPSEAETAEEVPGTDQEPTDDGEKNSQVDSETEEVKEPEASDAGKMIMRINLTKMVLVQKIPTQKTTDLTMRKSGYRR